MKLKDKVAIITGGSSGIGHALSLGFAKEGAKIVVAALHEEGCIEVVNEIKESGGEAIPFCLDVSDLKKQKELLDSTLNAFGKIDILINDAAYSRREKVLEVTPESWDRQMDVSLKALFFLSQSFAKQVIKQKSHGRIINIGSVAGVMDFHPVSIAYHAAKAGTIHVTRVMGADLAKYNITVNCISPGSTVSPMSKSQNKKYYDYMTQGIPEHRMAEPQEMVPPAVMFASDEAEYITGQTLFVEGGALAVYLGREEPDFEA